jgi:hypothetical protein
MEKKLIHVSFTQREVGSYEMWLEGYLLPFNDEYMTS